MLTINSGAFSTLQEAAIQYPGYEFFNSYMDQWASNEALTVKMNVTYSKDEAICERTFNTFDKTGNVNGTGSHIFKQPPSGLFQLLTENKVKFNRFLGESFFFYSENFKKYLRTNYPDVVPKVEAYFK